MMQPLEGVRLCVVLDRPEAVYSGMVPGFVAGDYAAHELEIDVVPLARRARARVILAAATRIDPIARRIELRGRPSISYDAASLDVGSSVRGLDLPGVREHALSTRPIRAFVDRLEERLAALPTASRGRVAIVGAGAAGIELACTLRARLDAAGRDAEICVLGESAEVMPGAPPGVAARARREAERRGVRLQCGVRVTGLEKDAVRLDRERLPCDLAVWATGAAPQGLLGESPLPRDERGFVRVRETLQVEGFDDLFATGDCASLTSAPWVPKAGVYAVRQGPVLDANLRGRLRGTRLRAFRPQRDFLSLLNLGARRALAAKWGWSASGRAAWHLKDRIDRRFMRRFQVLDAAGAPARDFPRPEAMGMEEMPCGGCAAKLSSSALERALARLGPPPEDPAVVLGLSRPDDAAAFAAPGGDVLLASVDAFRPFSDDPWLVGRVAAVNAASDVLAKGGRARHALALVNVPEEGSEREEETLFQVLSGVRAGLDPLGISLVGGHTTSGGELFVGLAVTGELPSPSELLPLDGARPGEPLVLTKALGTGVVLAADMQGRARGSWLRAACSGMLRSNAEAASIARCVPARACTDVSGFGLAGHLAELLRAGGVSAVLWLSAIPALEGALTLLGSGVRSSFHAQNAEGRRGVRADPALAGTPAFELIFDPQTSGGLLFSVPAGREAEVIRALHRAGDREAAVIGSVAAPRADGAAFEVRA